MSILQGGFNYLYQSDGISKTEVIIRIPDIKVLLSK